MFLRVINRSVYRIVDSGLKMLLEPILYWLVASQYYKQISQPEVIL